MNKIASWWRSCLKALPGHEQWLKEELYALTTADKELDELINEHFTLEQIIQASRFLTAFYYFCFPKSNLIVLKQHLQNTANTPHCSSAQLAMQYWLQSLTAAQAPSYTLTSHHQAVPRQCYYGAELVVSSDLLQQLAQQVPLTQTQILQRTHTDTKSLNTLYTFDEATKIMRLYFLVGQTNITLETAFQSLLVNTSTAAFNTLFIASWEKWVFYAHKIKLPNQSGLNRQELAKKITQNRQ